VQPQDLQDPEHEAVSTLYCFNPLVFACSYTFHLVYDPSYIHLYSVFLLSLMTLFIFFHFFSQILAAFRTDGQRGYLEGSR
jgi:hypothetical protein